MSAPSFTYCDHVRTVVSREVRKAAIGEQIESLERIIGATLTLAHRDPSQADDMIERAHALAADNAALHARLETIR